MFVAMDFIHHYYYLPLQAYNKLNLLIICRIEFVISIPMKTLPTFLLIIFNILGQNLLAQDTIRVPAEIGTIQEALDLSMPGTTVLVAPGTFQENIIWPEQDGIKLISEEGANRTILKDTNTSFKRLITMDNEEGYSSETVIQGFTLKDAVVQDLNGAGIFLSKGSPSFKNLKFLNNRIVNSDDNNLRPKGGAAYLKRFSGTIENCEFNECSISGITFHNKYGGALHIELVGDIQILNCSFKKNECLSAESCSGGGLNIEEYQTFDFEPEDGIRIKLSNCEFSENQAHGWYGGSGAGVSIYGDFVVVVEDCLFFENNTDQYDMSGGAGLSARMKSIQIKNSTFNGNVSRLGAAVLIGSFEKFTADIQNCNFVFNTTNAEYSKGAGIYANSDQMSLDITNCLFADNNGTSIEAEIQEENSDSLNLVHCTFVNNSKSIKLNNFKLNATNSILWNNGAEEISIGQDSSEIVLKNCLVSNGYGGQNVLTDDPEFIAFNNYILANSSPCVAAGIQTEIQDDLNGNPRPVPENTLPDLGAIEVDQTITSVKKNLNKFNIKTFPNPTSHSVFLSHRVDKYWIYNINGEMVSSGNFKEEFDVYFLEQGIYLVKYQYNDQLYYDNLVVQH